MNLVMYHGPAVCRVFVQHRRRRRQWNGMLCRVELKAGCLQDSTATNKNKSKKSEGANAARELGSHLRDCP